VISPVIISLPRVKRAKQPNLSCQDKLQTAGSEVFSDMFQALQAIEELCITLLATASM
jgi:hypothetical protein